MSDEKRRILEMVTEGRLTKEDAERLLEALGEDEDNGAQETGEAAEPVESESAGNSGTGPQPGPLPEDPFCDMRRDFEEMGAEFEAGVEMIAEKVGSFARRVGEEAKGIAETAVNSFENEIGGSGGDSQQTFTPYEAELPAGEMTDLKIEWVNGQVEIVYGGELSVTEYANRPLREDEHMSVKMDNGELKIKWAPKKHFRFSDIGLKKRLTVVLPEGVELHDIDVGSVSGKLMLPSLRGRHIELHTVSGEIVCEGVYCEDADINSVSGRVECGAVEAGEMDINTTSGSVHVGAFSTGKGNVNTVSGAINLSGMADKLDLASISGTVNYTVSGNMPDKLEVRTTSGGVTLNIPDTADGFRVKYSMTSGAFRCDFPLDGRVEKRGGEGVYGAGKTRMDISTMSGGIRLVKI